MVVMEGFSVFALLGLPEFRPGDDLAGILGDALAGGAEARVIQHRQLVPSSGGVDASGSRFPPWLLRRPVGLRPAH